MAAPTLFIFTGLPGSGKTTLARRLAADLGAIHLRIDTIEQALRDRCHVQVEGEGYRLAYRVAADNLRLGLNVVADSCNPIELTRREWEGVAEAEGAEFVNVETAALATRRRLTCRPLRKPRRDRLSVTAPPATASAGVVSPSMGARVPGEPAESSKRTLRPEQPDTSDLAGSPTTQPVTSSTLAGTCG